MKIENLKKSLKAMKPYEWLMAAIMIFIAARAMVLGFMNPAESMNPPWLTVINFIRAVGKDVFLYNEPHVTVSRHDALEGGRENESSLVVYFCSMFAKKRVHDSTFFFFHANRHKCKNNFPFCSTFFQNFPQSCRRVGLVPRCTRMCLRKFVGEKDDEY